MSTVRFCLMATLLSVLFSSNNVFAAVFTAGTGGTYSAIQAAVSAAIAAGGTNEVRVRQGTYSESITIPDTMTSGELAISGGWDSAFTTRADDPALTTINAGGSNRVFDISVAGGRLAIDGFTLTNGGGVPSGGGVRAYPTNAAIVELTNAHITGNSVTSVGGDASGAGVDVYLQGTSQLVFTNNRVDSNSAQSTTSTSGGGGIQLGCQGAASFQVVGNVFSFNTTSNGSGGTGSGTYLRVYEACGGTFHENQVLANQLTAGGGSGTGSSFWLLGPATGTLTVRRNIWLNNISHSNNLEQVSLIPSGSATLAFTDNVVAGDTGLGVDAFIPATGTLQLHNLTITGHASTGLSVLAGSGTAELYNSIVYNNGTNTSLSGVTSANNLVGVDPSFVNSANQDYRLAKGSSAIDAGDNARCAVADVRGFTRPADGDNNGSALCDIGAHEYPATTFADVPDTYFAFRFIEGLVAAGITSGCGGNNFCPAMSVTRAQMAVFLERGMHGATYTPPPATGAVFADVGASDFAAAWIEQLSADGITSGCGGGNYCPNDSVTRAQMAVFLLRASHGATYTPPASSCAVFPDVPAGSFACAWIEQLYAEGITSGCGGGNYCPNDSVTRAQMAVFLLRAFNLPVP